MGHCLMSESLRQAVQTALKSICCVVRRRSDSSAALCCWLACACTWLLELSAQDAYHSRSHAHCNSYTHSKPAKTITTCLCHRDCHPTDSSATLMLQQSMQGNASEGSTHLEQYATCHLCMRRASVMNTPQKQADTLCPCNVVCM